MVRLVFVAVLLAALPLHAQWLKHPTPGVPRLANGQPNLEARTPRTADGKPDFSGIWRLEARCAPGNCNDYPAGPEFLDIAARLKGGLPYQPQTAELVKKRAEQLGKDDPVGICKPSGAVRLLTFPPPRKFFHLPGLFLILSERDVTYRQIFMDGRTLPVDRAPSWNGFSIGRWEGDTLVVESNGFRDDTWLDRKGNFMTDATRLTERFRRINYGRLEVELTVDDPKAYTRPWTVTLNQVIMLDTELLDYHCMDNEKDAGRLIGK